ncbi:thiamine biosynthesis protein [Candidatus Kaiserbacteria bacterium GWA2_50_9]|uniref:FAD:protein FMN transferase n=1 Tax=Candidatus Kaiserbacteria bacterium GWA2_50_9 TaxID=1798474 RepID=A0A1F6BWJ5_9BACT|nr:MAG: thiamine biosynthesis protein [Candidatus Kaiserbacteria bacterium GWA2_50_9]
MKETRLIMGMPIEIEIVSTDATELLEKAFAYLVAVDKRFSPYKDDSEISRMNQGHLTLDAASDEMKEVFAFGEKTKRETNGYFDIRRPWGIFDPSGIVKGWAIRNTAALIRKAGHENFFVNAGGDIASSGENAKGAPWHFGIRNPFNANEIVKVVYPKGKGIATSGSYIRGDHIYNPHNPEEKLHDIVSITVIGPDVLEADRFATAAFAMGKRGIAFVEQLFGFEGYAIDAQGIATMTSDFVKYTIV